MHPGNSRKSPLAWSLVRASLLLLLLVAGQGDAAYLAGKEPLVAGDELQQDGRAGDLGEFASLAALLRDYLAGRLQELPSSKGRFAESVGAAQSVAKRGGASPRLFLHTARLRSIVKARDLDIYVSHKLL